MVGLAQSIKVGKKCCLGKGNAGNFANTKYCKKVKND